MRNVWSVGCIVVSACAIAACGGGGSASPSGTLPVAAPAPVPPGATAGPAATPSPSPTPAGRPYSLPSPVPVSTSAYSVDSNPRGLAVTVDGVASGTTPATVTPGYASTTHTIAIAPQGSATPYAVAISQTANGSHAVFYNAQSDTFGKIASISTTAVLRATAMLRAPLPRRLISGASRRVAYDARKLVVTYDGGALATRRVTAAAIEARHTVRSGVIAARTARTLVRVVTLDGTRALDDVRGALAAEPGVVTVDRVRLRYPLATAVYPNDPHFNPTEGWNLYEIGAPAAWGFGLGKPSVTIAVIDTGYDPAQPDVASQVTVSERVTDGRIYTDPGAANDTDGHGTALSSIASSATNNGAGWAGVAFGASLHEYKVVPDGAGAAADSSDVAAAIREAVDHKANVILLSLGGSAAAGPDPLERDAVAYALAAGVTVVAASGDERASGVTTLDYPAGYDGVVAVGASAIDDTQFPGDALASREYVPAYSNSGPGLTLVAPGGDPSSAGDADSLHWIESAYTTQPAAGTPGCGNGTAPADCGVLFAGTSVAAAHVAGAAALLLAQNGGFTPATIAALLSSSADDIGDPNQGAGRLDLRRAMTAATGQTATPGYVPAYRQFVAFAYTNVGKSATTPAIADVAYPHGVPVNADGTFRIADFPATIGAYRIAVWYDANGNGTIDANDYIGVSTANCAPAAVCASGKSLAVKRVAAGYTLP